MPGIIHLIKALPGMKDHFIIYHTDPERHAYLNGLFADKFADCEYCIITAIFYLTLCRKKSPKKSWTNTLGEKSRSLNTKFGEL